MNNGKRAQVEVTFNWIYIVIAGAVILLFFAGIIVKQKIASEQGLDQDVMRIMENIFTAAQVSENTKTVIDAGGLRDYTFYFKCEEGVTRYGLEGRSMPVEDTASPIFAPNQIQSSLFITWSVPYKLPFKVIDFLFVTSGNTKYLLYGDTDRSRDFIRAISNTSSGTQNQVGFNFQKIEDLQEIDPGKNFQIRIVDFKGEIKNRDKLPPAVEEKINSFLPERVTAVSFIGSGSSTKIQYFFYDQEWKRYNSELLPLISSSEKNDAAFYAAIFSGNDAIYQCNMKKAFQRLYYMNEIYGGVKITEDEVGGKLGEIISYYNANPESSLVTECKNYLINNHNTNLKEALQSHQRIANACLSTFQQGKIPDECSSLIGTSNLLKEANGRLREGGDCIPLY